MVIPLYVYVHIIAANVITQRICVCKTESYAIAIFFFDVIVVKIIHQDLEKFQSGISNIYGSIEEEYVYLQWGKIC